MARIKISAEEYTGAYIIWSHALHEILTRVNSTEALLRCWGLGYELLKARFEGGEENINYSQFTRSIVLARQSVYRQGDGEANYWAEVLFATPMIGTKTGAEKLPLLSRIATIRGPEFLESIRDYANTVQLPKMEKKY